MLLFICSGILLPVPMIAKATQIGFQIAVAALIALASASIATAQPCNPVIDGTYCADNMPKRSSKTRPAQRAPAQMQPIQPIRDPSSQYQDTPGTFGGISFSKTGERCVGLMRRGRCR